MDIGNKADITAWWYAYNSHDKSHDVALKSDKIDSGATTSYDPVTNPTGYYYVGFWDKDNYWLAGGTLPANGKRITLEGGSSSYGVTLTDL